MTEPNGRMVAVGSGAAAVPERRDPSVATVPMLRWMTPGQAVPAAWNAEAAFKNGYDASVWVARCVNVIADTIAGLPFRAGFDPDNRAAFDTNAPLARLLGPAPGGPAPNLSARRWWRWQIAQYLVAGRFAAEVELAAGMPIALWPLPAAYVRPIPTTSGVEWFSGFEVGGPATARPRTLKPDRMLYHWRPSGLDWREPESVLQAAQLPISVAVMLDRYSYSFLKNDARPAQVVVTQAFADDDDAEAFKNQFINQHAGPWNAGKTAFVEADDASDSKAAVSIQTMGLSQKDAQMLETGKVAAEEICVALGTPMSILDASGRTYSNAGEEKATWWRNTILPLIADLEEGINNQLAPRLGRHVGWFDLSKVPELQPPAKLDASAATLLVNNRLLTPNEARAELGLPPLPGGFTVVDLPPAPDPAAARSTTVVELHGLPGGAPAAGASDTRARGGSWESIDAKARMLEQSWVGTLQTLFEKQRRVTLDRLTGKRAKRVTAAVAAGQIDRALDPSGDFGIFDQSYWRAETAKVAEDLYRRVVAFGMDRVVDKFSLSFKLKDPWAVDFILDRANQLAGHTTSVTYAKVKEALAEGVDAGEDINRIAERVAAVFDEAAGPRSEVIARTEVISASNGTVERAALSLPSDVVGGKEWIAAGDERTRESHAAADGQIVAPSGTFDIGGSALRYPGDPAGDADEAINCRCALALLTPEEMPK